MVPRHRRAARRGSARRGGAGVGEATVGREAHDTALGLAERLATGAVAFPGDHRGCVIVRTRSPKSTTRCCGRTGARRLDDSLHLRSFGAWPGTEAIAAGCADSDAPAAIGKLIALCDEAELGAYLVAVAPVGRKAAKGRGPAGASMLAWVARAGRTRPGRAVEPGLRPAGGGLTMPRSSGIKIRV